ncbi:unnamed protein product [Sphagnum jensenii]
MRSSMIASDPLRSNTTTQPASQPANGSKSEVRERNKEGRSGGRFRLGKCHSSGQFQPRNMFQPREGHSTKR